MISLNVSGKLLLYVREFKHNNKYNIQCEQKQSNKFHFNNDKCNTKKIPFKKITLVRKNKKDYNINFTLQDGQVLKGHFKKFSGIWKNSNKSLEIVIFINDLFKGLQSVRMIIKDKNATNKVFNLLRHDYETMAIGSSKSKYNSSNKMKSFKREKRIPISMRRSKKSNKMKTFKRSKRSKRK